MDSLLKRIIKDITRPYHKLSVITNPDGFLCRVVFCVAMVGMGNRIFKNVSQMSDWKHWMSENHILKI